MKFQLDKIDHCCSELDSNVTLKDDGSVSFDPVSLEVNTFSIANKLQIDQDLSPKRREHIIRSAIFENGKAGEIIPASLRKYINIELRKYEKESERSFNFYSQISLSNNFEKRTFRHKKSTLVLNSVMDPESKQYWLEQTESVARKIVPSLPQRYATIKLTAVNKNLFDAFEKSIHTISIFRGLWNLVLNKGSYRMSMGVQAPLNGFVLAPMYIVRDKDKDKENRFGCWYEPNYLVGRQPENNGLKLDRIFDISNGLRLTLAKSSYRTEIENTLVKYALALDSTNWDYCFTKLWGLLETLTGTQEQPYRETMKRASVLYHHSDYHYDILDGLKHARNRIVHAGSDLVHEEYPVCTLKRYVEELILFHIKPDIPFVSMSEAGDYLKKVSTGTSPIEIQRDLVLSKRAYEAMKNLKKNK